MVDISLDSDVKAQKREVPLCKSCPLNCHVKVSFKDGKAVKYCKKWILENTKNRKK